MCAESSNLLLMTLNQIVDKTIERTEALLRLLKKVRVQKELQIDISASVLFDEKKRGKVYDQIRGLKNKYIYVFTIKSWKDLVIEIKRAYEIFNKKK